MFTLTPDQILLQDAAQKLAQKEIQPRAAEVDRSEEYPWDNVEKLTAAGFMGMTIPKPIWRPWFELSRCGFGN